MIKGITLSVVASILFGAMYYFTSTLTPLNGEQVYGWRTLLT
ncbi:EamA family transporter RarD, partial [Serratia marcescens]